MIALFSARCVNKYNTSSFPIGVHGSGLFELVLVGRGYPQRSDSRNYSPGYDPIGNLLRHISTYERSRMSSPSAIYLQESLRHGCKGSDGQLGARTSEDTVSEKKGKRPNLH